VSYSEKLSQKICLKYGLIPEFIGRLPVVASIDDLDEAALVKILAEPKNAIVKQYAKLFEMEGIELKFTDSALHEIAKKAIKRKTGARGLRTIMEDCLLEMMFEVPSMTDIAEVIVDDKVISQKAQPKTVAKKKSKASNS
jgi:ATP-dependent Clp protease ATP-binding subunit ClpX